MTIDEILQKNCDVMIPSGWNIYKWAEEHSKTTIAHAIKRVEKIMDFADGGCVQTGFSGGKDSTVTANLLCLELNLRRLRVDNNIDRFGNEGVDPLDAKWYHHRISASMTDAEVVFSDTNNYAKRFIKRMGPQGFDLIEFNWMCYPMAWQSGASFDSGILISWDEDKKSMWVQQMPTREDLSGFDCLNMDNLNSANPVPLCSLPEYGQKYHMEHDNVIRCKKSNLIFNYDYIDEIKNLGDNDELDAVANFGRGPINFITKAMHEKEEQDEYSYWFSNSSKLISDSCDNSNLSKYYDLSKDVWIMTPTNDRISVSTISLRAEESLDRRVILSQGEYSTGQYSNNNGMNICSPVFDFTVNDIWRLLSATDWDVNEVYERLYEIGTAPADQRVGSLLNYAAVRHIGTVKALEPELYARINARFQNVEFMSQFSRSGYYKIGKPKDTDWDGSNHIKAGWTDEQISELSDGYEHILKKYDIPYERNKDNTFKTTVEEQKGKPWHPLKDLVVDEDDREWVDKHKTIHFTWRDYTLFMLNSTAEPLRSIWREKIMTSMLHWNYYTGSISEASMNAMEVMSELPNWLTMKACDDAFDYNKWYMSSRLNGSKRPVCCVGHYPQESLTNEAMLCINYILDNWDECKCFVFESPALKKIWDLAQDSHGVGLIPDEALTILLEEKDGDKPSAWADNARKLFANGHTDKYKKYYKHDKIENFPLERSGDEETQKKYFKQVCEVWFKEDVAWSPCWKKVAICILKNDVTMKYAGFAPTLRERIAREEAVAAFSNKQAEKAEALAAAERLRKKAQ